MKKRVCIIGAGAAGLVGIRHVSKSPELTGTVFEETDSIGGVWFYKEKCESPRTDHGPMYKNMRTNLSRHVMGFPDFPFPDAFSPNSMLPSFMHHTEVLAYLKSYADHFQLHEHIKLNRRVVDLRPIIPESNSMDAKLATPKWRVTIQNTSETTMESESGVPTVLEFDAVLVCNGHFRKPFLPDIPNLPEFRGRVLHSKDYDNAEIFIDKRVLIIGCGPSGVDIALEVAEVASLVIISNIKNPLAFPLPRNTREVSRIEKATTDGFVCVNGERISCDALIFCTGYLFDFPFLTPECDVTLHQSRRIDPLYKDMIHIRFHNLCFIGIQLHVVPFMLFDFQVRYFMNMLEGRLELPNEETMQAEMESEKQLRISLGHPPSWSHELGDRQWEYYESLAQDGKFNLPAFMPIMKEIYDKTKERRSRNSHVYKNDQIHILSKERSVFQYIECPE